MTQLDDAYQIAQQDPSQRRAFYDLFLASLFYLPIVPREKELEEQNGALPLLVEANDLTYLMLFDTHKRLLEWADESVKFLTVPGYAITEMSSPNIWWALNYGTEQQKFFEPDEIDWLKQLVQSMRNLKQDDP